MAQTDAELTLRPFAPGDFEQLAELVGRTWLAEYPPRVQRAAGGAELAHYLARTTWSLLAWRGEALLGAVLLSERDREAADAETWSSVEARISRDAEGDPRLAEAVRVEMDGVEEEARLEDEYASAGGPGTDAAVKLLIVSPDAKGLGIGGSLFSAACEHLRKTGARGYHLLTDDACDVGFYEHKGLTRAMRRPSRASWPGDAAGTAGDEFCIYVYEQGL